MLTHLKQKKNNTISIVALVYVAVDHKLSLCKFCRRFRMYMNMIIHQERKGHLQFQQRDDKNTEENGSENDYNFFSFIFSTCDV